MADDTEALLKKHRDALQAKHDAVEKRLAPVRTKAEKLQAAAEEARVKAVQAVAELRAAEEADLVPLRNNLSKAARAIGGRAMGDVP